MILLFRRFKTSAHLTSTARSHCGSEGIEFDYRFFNRRARRFTDTSPLASRLENPWYRTLPRADPIRSTRIFTPKADAFSASLGEATRKTKAQMLLIANVALAGILVPLGIVLSRRMLKHGEAFQRALERSEERFNLAVNGGNDGIWGLAYTAQRDLLLQTL